MTEHDDKSTLDFLATECDYEVELSRNNDGSIDSAICDSADAGKDARDVIDSYKLLADTKEPFPTILCAIYNLAGKTPKIGL